MSAVPPSERFYRPRGAVEVKDRKARFAELNELARATGSAWLTSIPGAREVTMECLPNSSLPSALRAMGYTLQPDGEGQRLVPHAITETVIVEGSSETAFQMTHAGIITVQRYVFSLP